MGAGGSEMEERGVENHAMKGWVGKSGAGAQFVVPENASIGSLFFLEFAADKGKQGVSKLFEERVSLQMFGKRFDFFLGSFGKSFQAGRVFERNHGLVYLGVF